MATGYVDDTKLIAIADKIRQLKGSTDKITLDEMPVEIDGLAVESNSAYEWFDYKGGDIASACTRLDLTGLDTQSFTDFSYMFENMGVKHLDVSKFNTSKGTNFLGMFMNCRNLEELDISNFDFSKVSSNTDWYNLFNGCKNLKKIEFPKNAVVGTSSINNLALMNQFQDCQKLMSIDLSGFILPKCDYMSSVFSNCWYLHTLDMSSIDDSEYTSSLSIWDFDNSLINLKVRDNFAAGTSSLNFSYCPLSRESIGELVNKLATRTNSPVLRLSSGTSNNNPATFITSDEVAALNEKGWSVTGGDVIDTSKIIDNPENAAKGDYAYIDGELCRCCYVALSPQSWGQRIFELCNTNIYQCYEWGSYGTLIGATRIEYGTGLTNTNMIIAASPKSTDGTPTIWDGVVEFRKTHSDRWFVPSEKEARDMTKSKPMVTSTELSANTYRYVFNNIGGTGYKEKTNTDRTPAYLMTYV